MNDAMNNATWWERARRVIPGGVSSPVRSFGSVHGDPIFFASAKGSRFTSEDGSEYLDWCQSWGPLILGHAHPDVLEAVAEAAAEGMSFGAPGRREVELAEAVLQKLPFFDRVRFTSSGTEAVMSAIRVARGFTGRDRIVKFEGCYHGHSDALLVEAGSGLATFGTPSSAGVPEDFTRHTTVLPLDHPERLAEFFCEHGDEVAALVIEPIPANAGLLPQRPEFLRLCRELTERHGTLLLFDEVITGFRVAPGGAAELLGITPDLCTYGKVIGGGMPVGAFAGKAEIMAQLAPEGPVYQAGTLSGNPVAMAAGLATLRRMESDGFHAELERKGALLEAGLAEAIRDTGTAASVVRVGSLFWIAFQEHPPRAFAQIGKDGIRAYADFHREMLGEGVYLAPSGYEVGFLSAAHSEEDIARTARAARRSLEAVSAGAER
ncbi:MAG: glutamate-1-semialdehyde 2,1-aminomutase [Gemmatimonadota bacterium]|nr:glutamate-1-semialdehyde 2,1-aminomutase [Gemmatimonadota bacterium]MDP6803379.1 glutamate-1-semialdehyde 2,1-aminomutase [Gemmatimonadota bacterium]MDP7032412.1 glutamate-1-semialdehyde 2,1-aminomutase [Gemmatimonadota bacterium]